MAAPDRSSFSSPASDARARTRVLRSETEGLPWEYWQRDPPAELVGSVLAIWAGSDPSLGARHRVLPNGELSLMLHLGGAQDLVESVGARRRDPLGPGFLSGLQEQPLTFECSAPETRVVAARISPLGAWRLLAGLPQRALVHGVFDLESVIGPRSGIRALRERMLDSSDLGAALDLLEAWLIARIRLAPTPHPGLAHALDLLARDSGALPTRVLARECQLSPRRIREVFSDEIGIPAKRLARILRFRRVLDQLSAEPGADLSELALAHGYYDQPHLHREFRALAGVTPRGYLRALGDGADGPDVIRG